jgi:hypothetical protein
VASKLIEKSLRDDRSLEEKTLDYMNKVEFYGEVTVLPTLFYDYLLHWSAQKLRNFSEEHEYDKYNFPEIIQEMKAHRTKIRDIE